MKQLVARLTLIVGLAAAALLFAAVGGSEASAAAYPYCGPATGPCYGYGGYAGYQPYVNYTGYVGYTGVYNYATYAPTYYNAGIYGYGGNIFTAHGCAVGNYACLQSKGVGYYAPYWWL
jgi:hypothetical protein